MPQAWGPFTDHQTAEDTAAMVRRADIAYARDRQSRHYLAEILNTPDDAVPLADDCAFLFEHADPSRADAMIEMAGLPLDNTPLIALSPNMRVYERMTGKGPDNTYVKIFIEIIKHCVDLGARVILVPHEIRHNTHDDDDYLCEIIYSLVDSHPSVGAIVTQQSAADIKAVIGRSDMLIGSRFHSIVASLSSRTPCVVLGWSHKYDELMQSAGMQDYVLDYEHLDIANLLAKIDEVWSKRNELKAVIDSKVATIEERTGRLFDEVANVLQKGSA